MKPLLFVVLDVGMLDLMEVCNTRTMLLGILILECTDGLDIAD